MYRPHQFAFQPYNGMAVHSSMLLEPDASFATLDGGSCVLWVGWRARVDLFANCAKHQALREIRQMFAYARKEMGLPVTENASDT